MLATAIAAHVTFICRKNVLRDLGVDDHAPWGQLLSSVCFNHRTGKEK